MHFANVITVHFLTFRRWESTEAHQLCHLLFIHWLRPFKIILGWSGPRWFFRYLMRWWWPWGSFFVSLIWSWTGSLINRIRLVKGTFTFKLYTFCKVGTISILDYVISQTDIRTCYLGIGCIHYTFNTHHSPSSFTTSFDWRSGKSPFFTASIYGTAASKKKQGNSRKETTKHHYLTCLDFCYVFCV